MAETETVQILRVDTGEAVKNVTDLKENIKMLKQLIEGYTTDSGEYFEGLKIGTDEYKESIKQLNENQQALRAAMHASTASMEDVAKAAKGSTDSYNGLVAAMASLKEEFRSTTDAAKRADLGSQIKDINDQLKEMDAMQGNFQRNVGNYTSALDGLGGILKQFPGTLGPIKEQIGKVGDAMQLVGKQPILGIIGLLAPMIQKITAELNNNETAMNAIKKLMQSLQPIMDLASKGIEWLAGLLEKAVDWFAKMAGEGTGTFEKIIAGAVGVGNVIVQYLLTPIKTTIEAFKGLGSIIKDVFSGNFDKIKEDAVTAFDGIKDAFVNGFSFKGNFERGKEIGKQFAEGLSSSKGDVKNAAGELTEAASEEFNKLADEIGKEMEAEIAAALKKEQELNKIAANGVKQRLDAYKDAEAQALFIANTEIDNERVLADRKYAIQKEYNEKRLALLSAARQQAVDRGDLDAVLEYEKQAADLSIQIKNNQITEENRLREQSANDARAAALQRAENEAADERDLAARKYDIEKSYLEEKLALLLEGKQKAEEAGDRTSALNYEAEAAALSVQIESNRVADEKRLREQDKADSEERAKARISVLQGVASATSSILSSIADMYEADGEVTEEEAKKVKALRIASATIDTLSGAATAFATAMQLGPIAGPIVGAVNAAAVIATGIAQIKKIQATQVGSGGSSGGSTSVSTAMVQAPASTASTQQVGVLTGAKEEERLNQMASSQKVYILSSDIEASQDARKAQVSETSF